MVSALDVDSNKLIGSVAAKLEKEKLPKPEFVGIVKTGSHADRPPEQANFWYVRCASVMRQAYVNGVVGTNRLRRHYGGKKTRGVKPQAHRWAGGSTVRKAMQALEKAGYMEKAKPKGRQLTGKGRKLLDNCAKEAK
ncbi:MAG: 30S ribosomal protein S19e [Candidatus Bilamarchaeaceae archaeon]